MGTGIALYRRLNARDTAVWQGRGRMLLFVLGVGSLLGALVTFIAHNWVYLSTVGKLGFLGALLLASALAWVLTRFDRNVSQSVGILAQVLIGVWLAAAGQLYQAPGGVQDLLLTWAMLGLPFAMASRSAAHWTVWLGVAVFALVSPTGIRLAGLRDVPWSVFGLAAAAIPATAHIYTSLTGKAEWFATLMASVAAVVLGAVGVASVADFSSVDVLVFFLALAITAGLATLSWQRRSSLAAVSVFSVATVFLIVTLITRGVGEVFFDSGGDGWVFGILVLALLYGGTTYGLVKIFARFRAQFRADRAGVASVVKDDENDDVPWYMDALIALGGILSALMATLFVGFFLGVTLAMAEDLVWILLLLIGLGAFAFMLMLRRKAASPFLRYFSGTLLVAAAGAAIGGMAGMTSDELPGALLGIVLSAIAVWGVRDRVSETIFAALGAGCLFWLLSDVMGWQYRHWIEIAFPALAGAVGIIMISREIAGRHYLAVGAIFLLAAMLGSVPSGNSLGETSGLLTDWPQSGYLIGARLAVAAALVVILRLSPLGAKLPNLVALSLLTLIAAILPAGGVGAFLLLLTGYALGSRSLSLIGAIATAFFLYWAYFDLNLTLMELSAIMGLSGFVLLGIWRFATRRGEGVRA